MILAGDIGGTKTVLATYEPRGGAARSNRRTDPIRMETYPSREFDRFDAVVEKFLDHIGRPKIRAAAFGIAGPVAENRVKTTNLPWSIDGNELAQRFGIPHVMLLNDLEAMAWGVSWLADGDYETLQEGRPLGGANRALIAAGTGLGQAILFWNGNDHWPCASEGGHSDFAPRTHEEIELLVYLTKKFGRVSYERLLSGPGLANVYEFFAVGAGVALKSDPLLAASDPGAAISESALSGASEIARKAMNLFVEIYGAQAGNLALTALARDGVYLGGGIAPKLLLELKSGRFVEAFRAKGRLTDLLSQIPICVLVNRNTPLWGAARVAARLSGG